MLSGQLSQVLEDGPKSGGAYSGTGKDSQSALVLWAQLPRQVAHLLSVLAASPCTAGQGSIIGTVLHPEPAPWKVQGWPSHQGRLRAVRHVGKGWQSQDQTTVPSWPGSKALG